MYGNCRRCRPEYEGILPSVNYDPFDSKVYSASSAFGYVEHKDSGRDMQPAGHFRKLQM